MSAFFVGKQTIDAALSFLATQGEIEPGREFDSLGQELWLLNASALCQRYARHGETLDQYTDQIANYTFTMVNAPTVTLFKQLQCVLYQCSEGDIAQTQLFQDLSAIADHFQSLQKSDAYDSAPWGID